MMKFTRKRFLITPEQYESLKGTPSSASDPYYIPHPNAKAAKEYLDEATSTLSTRNASEYDKILIHSQEIQSYLQNLKDALTIPKSAALLGNSARGIPSSVPPPSSSLPPKSKGDDNAFIPETPSRKKTGASKKRRDKKKVSETPILPTTPPATPMREVKRSEPYSSTRLLDNLASTEQERATLTHVLAKLDENPKFSWNRRNGYVSYDGRRFEKTNMRGLLSDVLANKRHLSNRAAYSAVLRALS